MRVLTERCRVHPESRLQTLADGATLRDGWTEPLSPACCLFEGRKVLSAREIEYFGGLLPGCRDEGAGREGQDAKMFTGWRRFGRRWERMTRMGIRPSKTSGRG